jgi:hypothetical protein
MMQHCTQDAKETPFGILGTPNDLDSGTCQLYSSILTSDPTFLTFLSKTGLKHGVIAVRVFQLLPQIPSLPLPPKLLNTKSAWHLHLKGHDPVKN